MNGTYTHDHDWAVRQLTAYSVGMLPEQQTLRLEEHLGDCSDCRARLASLKSLSPADVGHLPASLIATWPRATRLLSGIERGLVESHLRSCDGCRATLAFAGHEPVLSSEPVALPARAVREPARRSAWGWALGLSGAVAAAAWLLVVQPALVPHATNGQATMGSLAHRAADTAVLELAVPATTVNAVALPDLASALSSRAPVTVVGPVTPTAALVLIVPASLQPASPADGAREVVLTLVQGNHEWARRSCRLGELGDALRVRPVAAMPAGDYLLRVAVGPGSASEPAQVGIWPLRLR